MVHVIFYLMSLFIFILNQFMKEFLEMGFYKKRIYCQSTQQIVYRNDFFESVIVCWNCCFC